MWASLSTGAPFLLSLIRLHRRSSGSHHQLVAPPRPAAARMHDLSPPVADGLAGRHRPGVYLLIGLRPSVEHEGGTCVGPVHAEGRSPVAVPIAQHRLIARLT